MAESPSATGYFPSGTEPAATSDMYWKAAVKRGWTAWYCAAFRKLSMIMIGVFKYF
jgi:hypothetical protein